MLPRAGSNWNPPCPPWRRAGLCSISAPISSDDVSLDSPTVSSVSRPPFYCVFFAATFLNTTSSTLAYSSFALALAAPSSRSTSCCLAS